MLLGPADNNDNASLSLSRFQQTRISLAIVAGNDDALSTSKSIVYFCRAAIQVSPHNPHKIVMHFMACIMFLRIGAAMGPLGEAGQLLHCCYNWRWRLRIRT